MLDWNSASHVPFFDPTSSAASSGFEETTAPSGNLARAMRNWVLVVEQPGPPIPKLTVNLTGIEPKRGT